MYAVFGNEDVYLISGNLHRQGDDLAQTSHKFRQMLEEAQLEQTGNS